MKRTLICLATCITALSMTAESYFFLTKEDVNLREAPSTTADIVEKGKKGSVFVLEESKTGWYKGRSAQYGDTPLWISSSVSEKSIGDSQIPAWNIVNMPEAVIPYVNEKNESTGVVVSEWNFTTPDISSWNEEKPGTGFEALQRISVVSHNGSVRTYETYYKGAGYAYYLMLNEESKDGGETYTKLDKPIYVYPSLQAESGIFVDGVFFPDAVGMDEEW